MTLDPSRRLLCALLLALAASAPAMAADSPSFEGTWGGAQGELSAQVIVTGGEVIGFFWRADYVDTHSAALSGDGKRLSFEFAGGQAVLTRETNDTATLQVTEGGKVTRLELKRD
jgi:opacity protein-like surface antigen